MNLETSTYNFNGTLIKKSPNTECWRLIHDNVNVLSLFLSDGITETSFNLECWTSEEECRDRINQLGLIEVQEDTSEYDSIEPPPHLAVPIPPPLDDQKI